MPAGAGGRLPGHEPPRAAADVPVGEDEAAALAASGSPAAQLGRVAVLSGGGDQNLLLPRRHVAVRAELLLQAEARLGTRSSGSPPRCPDSHTLEALRFVDTPEHDRPGRTASVRYSEEEGPGREVPADVVQPSATHDIRCPADGDAAAPIRQTEGPRAGTAQREAIVGVEATAYQHSRTRPRGGHAQNLAVEYGILEAGVEDRITHEAAPCVGPRIDEGIRVAVAAPPLELVNLGIALRIPSLVVLLPRRTSLSGGSAKARPSAAAAVNATVRAPTGLVLTQDGISDALWDTPDGSATTRLSRGGR
jgi:hypothetical protein